MSELVDWGFRTLQLLVLSLFPFWGAVDVAPAPTGLTTVTRLAWLSSFVVVAAVSARFGWRRHRALVLGALGVLGVSAWRAYRAGGLEQELLFVAPPAWALVACALAASGTGSGTRQQRGKALLFSLSAVAFSFGVAWPRIGSEPNARRVTLRGDPGNERAALRLVQLLDSTEGVRAASAVLRACARVNRRACGCLEGALERDLRREEYAAGSELLHSASDACALRPSVVAMTAEIAAATAVDESFVPQVALSIERAPAEPHTWYAQALVSLRREDLTAAREQCERAIAADRGVAAHATLGAILYRLGELAAAEASLARALRGDPAHLQALYNLALIDQVRERSVSARAGYARVLELRPQHWDARYNLALLALKAGDKAEAQRELAAIENGAGLEDARAVTLRGLFANP